MNTCPRWCALDHQRASWQAHAAEVGAVDDGGRRYIVRAFAVGTTGRVVVSALSGSRVDRLMFFRAAEALAFAASARAGSHIELAMLVERAVDLLRQPAAPVPVPLWGPWRFPPGEMDRRGRRW